MMEELQLEDRQAAPLPETLEAQEERFVQVEQEVPA
jgi:hypothetical protein